MSSHYGGSPFASTHHNSSHYGGVGIIIRPPARGGIEDAYIYSRRAIREEEEDFVALLVAAVTAIERDSGDN